MATIGELMLERLSRKERDSLPDKDFVYPKDRAWPVQDKRQAEIALDYVRMKRGRADTKAGREKVLKRVEKDYPSLDKEVDRLRGKKKRGPQRLAASHDDEGEYFDNMETESMAHSLGDLIADLEAAREAVVEEYGYDLEEGEGVEGAIKGLKAGMHMLRERADYLWDILEKSQDFDVRRRMGRLIENIKHTEESVYGFIDTFDKDNDHSKDNMKP